MMSGISDEIRNWREFEDGTECRGFVTKASFDKLCALADRIDSEMMELPKDADGVPIHIDDTVWNIWGGGEAMTVKSITLHPCGVAGIGFYVLGSDTNINPTDLSHTRPDSLEHIARDLEDWAEGNISGSAQSFANRIRKLAKEGER